MKSDKTPDMLEQQAVQLPKKQQNQLQNFVDHQIQTVNAASCAVAEEANEAINKEDR